MTPPKTTPCPKCGRKAVYNGRITGTEGNRAVDKASYLCPACRRVTVVLDLLAIRSKG